MGFALSNTILVNSPGFRFDFINRHACYIRVARIPKAMLASSAMMAEILITLNFVDEGVTTLGPCSVSTTETSAEGRPID